MPRPMKCRRVCYLPSSVLFGPLNIQLSESEIITMTVDEYETIRLIDLEGMTQEECAEKMGVARTTIQRIYNDSRRKLALTLVNGRILRIQGGDYKLCEEGEPMCGCKKCCKRQSSGNE